MRPGTVVRATAAVGVAAIGAVALGSVWDALSDAAGVAFATWIVGGLVLGSLVAVISPFRWAGLALGAVGIAIGSWIELQLAGEMSSVAFGVLGMAAVVVPALVGFLLAARRLGWNGSDYRYPDVVPLAHPLPAGFPEGWVDGKSADDDHG